MVLLSVYFKDCRHYTVLIEFYGGYLLVLPLLKYLHLPSFLLDTARLTLFLSTVYGNNESLFLCRSKTGQRPLRISGGS